MVIINNLNNILLTDKINIGIAKLLAIVQFFLQYIIVPAGNKTHNTPHKRLCLNAWEIIFKSKITTNKRQAAYKNGNNPAIFLSLIKYYALYTTI